MKVLSLTEESFDSAVTQLSWLVIEFSGDIEDFADRASKVMHADRVHWGHVDTRTEVQLAAAFGITAETALLIFREQIVLYLEVGNHDSDRIADLLARVSSLEMQQIKTEIEERKQAELALRMRRVCPTTRRGPNDR
jgi:thioredoxin 1